MKFLDTNVILRFLTRDDEAKADACLELFRRVNQGEEELFTLDVVVAETTYILSSSRWTYRLNHSEIRDRLLPILRLRGLRLPQK